MKKQVITTVKGITSVGMLSIVLFVACNSNTKTNHSENSSTAVASEKPKPPAMDIQAAAFMGNTKVIQQHIAAGTDLNKQDDYGSTPLHTATLFGKTEAALALIEGGADINATSSDGSTPLHTAAFFCRVEVVEALLEKGANKEIRNNYGSTPYESVAGPFDQVKPVYDQLGKDLGQMGLKLDYEYLQNTRPKIAQILL